jgi:transmembrane sensor
MDSHSSSVRQDPLTQASEFFVEFRAGDGSAALRARFEKWIRSSPANVQAYLEIAAGWTELPTADPEGRIDLRELLAAARNGGDDNVVQLRPSRTDAKYRLPTQLRARPWVIAASLALMIGLIGTGFWVYTSEGSTYSTGIGEQRTLLLADGSTVILNALTTVRVHMTKEVRRITLVRGQAYFRDTDEPTRPFIVRSGDSTVRAIGTQFDVDKESLRTVVTVLEGKVAVANSLAWIERINRAALLRDLAKPATNLNGVLVSTGEQVTLLPQNIPPPRRVDLGAVVAWLQHRLVFEDTPLEKVAEEFNLYNRQRLVIADPSLRTIGVSGSYSISDPAALIGFLRSQPTLRVIEKDDQILVTGR